jgi:hypothetical protein
VQQALDKRDTIQVSELGVRVIVILYLILGALYATATPPWQAPDEPAHYNYVKYIAEHGQLPELQPGDYPHEYLEEIKAARFSPDLSVDPIRYEFHQPPLYYLVSSIIYRINLGLFDLPMLLVLRGLSLLLGAAALRIGYNVVRAVYPQEPLLALGAVAFAATLPMHLTMTATVNNDVLTGLLLAYIAWKVFAMQPGDWTPRRSLGLGALLGLAFLTKLQSYAAFGIVLFALAWDTWQARRGPSSLTWRRAIGCAGILLGTALVVASPWLLNNIAMYGLTDPLGLARHDAVVTGQLTTAQYLADHGALALARAFIQTTFQSFWGQFGWMGVVLPQRVYLALAVLSGLVIVGAIAYAVRVLRGGEPLQPATRRGLVLLLVWGSLSVMGYLWWNTKYLQHQARYLFPALIPWGVAFTLGFREVLRRAFWPALALLGLAALATLGVGLAMGDVKGFTLALLVVAAGVLAGARWLEQRRPGAPLALFYSGMAAFAILCLYVYVVPALRP